MFIKREVITYLMSVIAVKNEAGSISVAADSILIKGDMKKTNFQKIQKFNDMIVGGCGSAEELSLFFLFAQEHVLTDVSVKGVTDYILEFSRFKEEYTDKKELDNEYIICYDKHVFEASGLFVQEVEEFTAIGEGEPFALAALKLEHSVKEAVQVACSFCCNVSEPIIQLFL